MVDRRIEKKTSRTAAMTCMTRAASFLDRNPFYHSDDHISLKMLPGFARLIVHMPLINSYLFRRFAPVGVYEYVVARTKYIDDAFQRALAEGFGQILLFGAGYDTRGLRFKDDAQNTRIFELDSPHTQKAKIEQLQKRGFDIPSNMIFIPIDFDSEYLRQKLEAAGFQKNLKTLFVLEGVLMYLSAESVTSTFRTIESVAGKGSRVVFDYLRASVLSEEGTLHGEAELKRTVSKAKEKWQTGFEPEEVGSFAKDFGFVVRDHKCAEELEATYFSDQRGRRVARVNATHCIVTLEER